jgi:hypothetical protein
VHKRGVQASGECSAAGRREMLPCRRWQHPILHQDCAAGSGAPCCGKYGTHRGFRCNGSDGEQLHTIVRNPDRTTFRPLNVIDAGVGRCSGVFHTLFARSSVRYTTNHGMQATQKFNRYVTRLVRCGFARNTSRILHRSRCFGPALALHASQLESTVAQQQKIS